MLPRSGSKIVMRWRRPELTVERMLRAYRAGLFPMAEDRDSTRLFWLDPPQRGVLPLDKFHLPRRLARTTRSQHFTVSVDQDFPATLRHCAEAQPDRPQTWINLAIERAFVDLHQAGYAHSVECRREGELVGGLYGLALGGAFFGESMFSTARDASKVALVHLVLRLRLGGFALLDTQFLTTHLAQFGATEVPRLIYQALLNHALQQPARFPRELSATVIDDAIASMRNPPSAMPGHIS